MWAAWDLSRAQMPNPAHLASCKGMSGLSSFGFQGGFTAEREGNKKCVSGTKTLCTTSLFMEPKTGNMQGSSCYARKL